MGGGPGSMEGDSRGRKKEKSKKWDDTNVEMNFFFGFLSKKTQKTKLI